MGKMNGFWQMRWDGSHWAGRQLDPSFELMVIIDYQKKGGDEMMSIRRRSGG